MLGSKNAQFEEILSSSQNISKIGQRKLMYLVKDLDQGHSLLLTNFCLHSVMDGVISTFTLIDTLIIIHFFLLIMFTILKRVFLSLFFHPQFNLVQGSVIVLSVRSYGDHIFKFC
jgi:hypothetical protein